MSADEFDARIERLFAQAPRLADADAFAAGIETRLNTGSRMRGWAVGLAGLVGGAIAVRETVRFDMDATPAASDTVTVAASPGQPLGDVALDAQAAIQPLLDQLGVSAADLGVMGGTTMFWMTAAVLVALLAAGALRLSQEI